MRKAAVMACAALLLAAPVCADSIDDAEAKRRGVPVSQVLAEKALAAEQHKTADLEKRLADLKKQLAELQGAGGTTSPALNSASAPPPTTPPAANLPADGTLLYNFLVNNYLEGTWTTLAADVAARSKEIAALPADKAADIKYIGDTVAECRPGWWNDVKSGKTTQFKQNIFGQAVSLSYQDRPSVGFGGTAIVNGAPATLLLWPRNRMDSPEGVSMAEMGMALQGNYRHGDAVDRSIWSLIGGASVPAQAGTDKLKALSPDEKTQFAHYAAFWQTVVSAYYATPPARQLACVMSLASFEQGNNGREEWEGRRPFGSFLLIETKQHHYASVKTMPIAGLSPEMDQAEEMLGKVSVLSFNSGHLSLADDKMLRGAIKTLAEGNKTWSKETLDLPNGLHYDLDTSKDAANRQERVAFELGQKKP